MGVGVLHPDPNIPDTDGKKPARARLYSITSTTVGDDETSSTMSLCVKRLVEIDGKYSNIEDDSEYARRRVYRGIFSDYVCRLKPGEKVQITGPTGKVMLLPSTSDFNLVMFATGTGIAPFRAFLRRFFHDKETRGSFRGKAVLYLGVPYTESLLYDDEFLKYKTDFPNNFEVHYAISREQADDKKRYVQDLLTTHEHELRPLIKDPKTHVYMCGLKPMKGSIDKWLGADCIKELKSTKRYHTEVY